MKKEERDDRLPLFAERFAALRGDQSQEAFAQFLGISRPTVGFYESGARIPDAVTLRRIAERCMVSTDYLLGLTDTKTPEGIRGAFLRAAAIDKDDFYALEIKLARLQYSLHYDEENGAIFLDGPEGLIEVTLSDLNKLQAWSDTHMGYLLYELRKARKKEDD